MIYKIKTIAVFFENDNQIAEEAQHIISLTLDKLAHAPSQHRQIFHD